MSIGYKDGKAEVDREQSTDSEVFTICPFAEKKLPVPSDKDAFHLSSSGSSDVSIKCLLNSLELLSGVWHSVPRIWVLTNLDSNPVFALLASVFSSIKWRQ